ncbi:MAG: hydrogenase maturation protease [Planctomycetes bacterium]|nr:hydrogenase maturation protease [Planctomycetota bacterium]
MTKKVLIGLGNLLMTDEGIGVRIIQELVRTHRISSDIEALDLGPGGLPVLHALDGVEHAIFVDCAFMGEEPGTLKRFRAEEAQTVKVQARQSAHEGDLFETLELAKRVGQCPSDIVVFGIQPGVVELGVDLSPTLEEQLPAYVDAVAAELNCAD